MKDQSNHPLNNHVVKVLSEEHGKQVIQAFKDKGIYVDTYEGNKINAYYGLYDGKFTYMLASSIVDMGVKYMSLTQLTFHTPNSWMDEVHQMD